MIMSNIDSLIYFFFQINDKYSVSIKPLLEAHRDSGRDVTKWLVFATSLGRHFV